MNIVILGAPGCGKGTQSHVLAERYNLSELATGDCLRDAVKGKTRSGVAAKEAMDSGKLIRDEVVFGAIREAIERNQKRGKKGNSGFILDGLPRTVDHAKRLEAALGQTIDAVIMLNVPDDILIQRMTGRLIHPASGRSYHLLFAPPKVAGKDDVTGEPLVQRSDDKKEVVTKRLEVFQKVIGPIEEFYRKERNNSFFSVNANRRPKDVTKELTGILEPIHEKKRRAMAERQRRMWTGIGVCAACVGIGLAILSRRGQ